MTPDVIDAVAGITPGSRLEELRAKRPDVKRHAQASYLALLEPADPAGLGLDERALLALHVAKAEKDEPLAAFYAQRVKAVGADPAASTPRLKALYAHADFLIHDPISAAPEKLEPIRAAGFTPAQVVTLSQLIAFVTFQTRALAGLRLLGAAA